MISSLEPRTMAEEKINIVAPIWEYEASGKTRPQTCGLHRKIGRVLQTVYHLPDAAKFTRPLKSFSLMSR